MPKLAGSAADELVLGGRSRSACGEALDGHGVQTSWGMTGLFDEKINPHALELLKKRRDEIRAHIRGRYPQEYEHLLKLRKEFQEWAQKKNRDAGAEDQK